VGQPLHGILPGTFIIFRVTIRHPGNNGGNGHKPPQDRPRFASNGGNGATATRAQVRAIQAIGKANGLSLGVLTVLLQGRYGCRKLEACPSVKRRTSPNISRPSTRAIVGPKAKDDNDD